MTLFPNIRALALLRPDNRAGGVRPNVARRMSPALGLFASSLLPILLAGLRLGQQSFRGER